MNRNDEQFDEFLRSQFKQKTFEMKGQYWSNAQQMIATHRATAGQGMLNVVLSGIVLVALSVGLLWNSANTPSAAKQEKPAFLASTLPLESNTHVVLSANITSPNEPAHTVISNTSPTNSSVSGNTSQPKNAERASSQAKPQKRFVQQQRTRKSVLAEQNTIATASDEQVILNVTSDIVYINGKLFHPIKGVQKGLTTDLKRPDFLTYAANRSKGFLTIEGGVNSYNLSSTVNFHGGLRYYRFISPKFALSTGLTYSRLQQNLDARVYRSVDYSFGQNSNETKITTVRLDYIELPVAAYYNIKGNHYIQAGATLGYAFQSHDLIETNGSKENSSNGYLDGINKVDVQFNIGYTLMIQNRYTLSASYYMGLIDVTKNTSFHSDKTDCNNGVRLTIGYKLF
ncbi:MAG: porin family protein [Bacteroidota bacterium]